ncbi:MAG: SBBP repeat-containing protein [Bacteroidetes bacterium]|nr:SBBP repeat-containing protein [Bacteroidota bacterium]
MLKIKCQTRDPSGGSYFQAILGNFDIFLVKFDNSGVWIWATYYGGSGGGGSSRWGTIAVDGSNNLFVTGRTNCTNFPVLNLAGAYFQPAISGIQDAFILKFNNNGVRLWATYYGGSGDDQGYSIAIDASNDVFIAGSTSSVNFPVLNLAGAYNQPASGGLQDVFILKLNNSGVQLWATYYGGSGDDLAYSIAIDNSNNILITGSATSVNFPVLNLAGAYNQPGNAGGQDAFVLKFNNSGVRLWATYYGGSGTDQGCSVAIDGTDNVFVVGNTSSANLPLLNLAGAYNQPGYAGVQDIFILKFNSSGLRLWATYFGGNSFDFFRNYTDHEITIDACGNLYVTGGTNSTDFPVLNPGCGSHFQGTYAGGSPYGIFFLKFSNNGILLWSTHSGASALGFGSALAIDVSGNLFAVGEWFYPGSNGLIDPGGGAYFDATFNTSDDSYIMKFIPLIPAYTQTQINSTGCSPCNGSATINLTCSEPNYSYVWSNGTSTLNSVSAANTLTGLCPGSYTVTATSNCNQTQAATFVITGIPCGTCTLTGQFTKGTANCTGCGCKEWLMVNATGGTSPYSYSWPDGYDKRYKNQLCPGVYNVNIKDKNGCSVNVNLTVP